MRFRFRWPVRTTGKESGNFLGYASATDRMREALVAAGGVEDDVGPVAVHLCFPLRFTPEPGAKNVLFTMFENPGDEHALREVFKPAMNRADLVVVPSRFCVEMFERYTDTPIEVCPLGVDTDVWRYKRRRWPGMGKNKKNPFIWLYCGAPNRRKFTVLWEVWRVQREAFGRDVMLYLKHTGLDIDEPEGAKYVKEFQRHETPQGEVLTGGNVIVDNRRLELPQLVEIYHAAHGFLFLHCGEGWGLTGLEAMATGLPTVVTDYSGTQEFATKKTAYLVNSTHQTIPLKPDPERPDLPETYEGQWPDFSDACAQAAAVQADYRRAQRIGRAGAKQAKALSWRAAGRRLAEILSRL